MESQATGILERHAGEELRFPGAARAIRPNPAAISSAPPAASFPARMGSGARGDARRPCRTSGRRAKTISTRLRWAVRSDGHSGFVFVNNYQRLEPLPAKTNVQFTINLPGGSLTFPETPVTIPSGARFIWPFNLDLGKGIQLKWATAQPITAIDVGNVRTVFFAETPGVSPRFAFARQVQTNVAGGRRGFYVESGRWRQEGVGVLGRQRGHAARGAVDRSRIARALERNLARPRTSVPHDGGTGARRR